MEHTELPWEIMWQGSDSFAVGIRDRQLVVAEVVNSHVESETAEANAEYIVRACNAFPAMMDLVGRYAAVLEAGHPECKNPECVACRELEACNAALAAGGEE